MPQRGSSWLRWLPRTCVCACVLACGVAQEPVRIVGSVPLTGSLAVSASRVSQAAELFSAMVNASGGLLLSPNMPGAPPPPRRPLSLELFDDGSDLLRAVSIYSNLSASGGRLLFGPYSSEFTLGVLGSLVNASEPHAMLSATASVTNLFVPFPRAFGLLKPTATRFLPILRRLRALGAATVLFGTAPPAFARDACSADVASLGFTAVGPNATVFVMATAADMSTFVDLIKQTRPNVVAVCGFFPTVRDVLTLARDRNANADAWMGVGVFDDPRFPTDPVLSGSYMLVASPWASAKELEGVALADYASVLVSQDSTCFTLSPLGCMLTATFSAAFSSRFGFAPPQDAAITFAWLEVMAQAIAAGGSANASIVAEQLSARTFDTVIGPIRFGVATRQNTGELIIRQALPAALGIVGPADIARRQLVYPAPSWAQRHCSSSHACNGVGTCQSDGSCSCNSGYGGDSCQYAFGVPVIVIGVLIGTALIAYIAALVQRSLQSKRLKRQAAEQRKQQLLVEAASRLGHERTMAFAAHELGNPLQTITATLEEVDAKLMAPERAFRRVRMAALQMERVMHDMAATTSGDFGLHDGPLHPRPTALADVLRDVRHRLQHVSSLALDVRVQPDVPAVLDVDTLRLYQLLLHSLTLLREGDRTATHAVLRVERLSPPQAVSAVRRPITTDLASPAAVRIRLNDAPATAPGSSTMLVAGRVLGKQTDVPQQPLAENIAAGASETRPPGDVVQLLFAASLLPVGAVDVPVRSSAVAALQVAAQSTDSYTLANSTGEARTPRSIPAAAATTPAVVPTSTEPGQADTDAHIAKEAPIPAWSPHPLRFAPVLGPLACQQLAERMQGTLVLDLIQPAKLELRLPVFAVQDALDVDDVLHDTDHAPQVVAERLLSAATMKPDSTASAPGSSMLTQGFAATEQTPITLDLSAPPGEAGAAESQHAALQVLIVEDEVVNARLASRMARRAGWVPSVVHDGVHVPFLDGSQPTSSHAQFACVLLDIVMHYSNGVDVARSIRQAGYTGLLVAMTSNTSEADVRLYDDAGFDSVLGKPFSARDLQVVLDAAQARVCASGQAGELRPMRPLALLEHTDSVTHPRASDVPTREPIDVTASAPAAESTASHESV